MNIYVAHSIIINYIDDLYNPIKNFHKIVEHNFYFPHDKNNERCNGYTFYKQFDLILAEVSEPSTGLGIELGWANILQIPILCIYKRGSKITSSLKAVTDQYIEYENSEDLLNKLFEYINDINKIL